MTTTIELVNGKIQVSDSLLDIRNRLELGEYVEVNRRTVSHTTSGHSKESYLKVFINQRHIITFYESK